MNMIRSFTIIILLIVSAKLNAQITVTTARFGNLKLGSSLDSVNSLLGQKIKLPAIREDGEFSYDTIYTTYRSATLRLVFYQHLHYQTKKLITELNSIYSESNNVITKSGIKTGDNKFEVIKKLDGMFLTIQPEKEIGKNASSVLLYDRDNSNRLTFYFRENILYAIEFAMNIDDAC